MLALYIPHLPVGHGPADRLRSLYVLSQPRLMARSVGMGKATESLVGRWGKDRLEERVERLLKLGRENSGWT
jgi:hypothetical protein